MKKFLIGLCVLGLSMFSIPSLLVGAEDVNIEETTIETEAETIFETEATEVTELETETVFETETETVLETFVPENSENEIARIKDIINTLPEKNGEVIVDSDNKTVTFKGTNKLNVFEFDFSSINSSEYTFDYKIPEFSYAVIKFGGESITAYTQKGILFDGSSLEVDISSHILYDFSNAKEIEIKGTEAFYGTIYAPESTIISSEKTLVTGNIFAKNVEKNITIKSIAFKYGVKNASTTVISTSVTKTTNVTTTMIANAPKTGRDYNITGLYIFAIGFLASLVLISFIVFIYSKKNKIKE